MTIPRHIKQWFNHKGRYETENISQKDISVELVSGILNINQTKGYCSHNKCEIYIYNKANIFQRPLWNHHEEGAESKGFVTKFLIYVQLTSAFDIKNKPTNKF